MDAGALLDILGNENRRRILRLLSRKPCYVTEISEHLGVSPKAVIDHLRRLEDAGLVESRTDDQRRKYFNISQNLRLEVTVAPYGFGMKSAYPASPNLDLSSCQYLTLEISRERTQRAAADGQGGLGGRTAEPDVADIARLAGELDELEAVERELSLAQRWVQGRIADVIDHLAETMEDESYLDAEVLAAVAGGAGTVEAIAEEVDAPPRVVEDCLRRLRERGLLGRDAGGWSLAT